MMTLSPTSKMCTVGSGFFSFFFFSKKDIKYERSIHPLLFFKKSFWFLFFPLTWNTKSVCWSPVIGVHSALLLGFPYLTWFFMPHGLLCHLWPLWRVEEPVLDNLEDSAKFPAKTSSLPHRHSLLAQVIPSSTVFKQHCMPVTPQFTSLDGSWIKDLYIHLPVQYLH